MGHGVFWATQYHPEYDALAASPGRKDLRWQLGVDDEVLDPTIRRAEFVNCLRDRVLGAAGTRDR